MNDWHECRKQTKRASHEQCLKSRDKGNTMVDGKNRLVEYRLLYGGLHITTRMVTNGKQMQVKVQDSSCNNRYGERDMIHMYNPRSKCMRYVRAWAPSFGYI